ncbi:MAG: phytoene desaturase family protein [Gammaproteobacteria bacterium]|jgi:1-hydroxycarotenoid 3,4-desaturase|nr:phytoene desaturase family protein [Gammaproteobacteria bacterium]
MTKHVVVVGAGVGGLTTAVALATRGLQVTVLERGRSAGGKLRQVFVDGAAVDSGPTVMTMRWVFDELLAAAGTALDEHITLVPAETIARHSWRDGSVLDLYADAERSADAIGDFAGADEARAFRAFSTEAQRIYATLETDYLRAPQTGMLGLTARFGLRRLPELAGIRPYTRMWRALGQHFKDPRLQQLYGRYAGYCGASPFLAPATLMLVAAVEQQGVWLIEGGMYRLIEMLGAQAERLGAELRMRAPVARLMTSGRTVTGVQLESGEEIPADAVVFNGDISALGNGLLGAQVMRAATPVALPQRSMSAVTWSMNVPRLEAPLLRHNVYFADDYQREFHDIFSDHGFPEAPTVYVCAQDRDANGRHNGSSTDRLLLIMNAASTGDVRSYSEGELAACVTRTFEQLRHCGLSLEPTPEQSVITTPSDFERMFPGTGGALYGRASHGWMSAFRRPGSRTPMKHLYLAGGSTHPGPGVPMAGLSGRAAAHSLLQDFDLIKP